MSTRVIGILIAAGLIVVLVIGFTIRERTQMPTGDSTGSSDTEAELDMTGARQVEIPESGAVAQPIDEPERTGQVEIGVPVDPVNDRWGIPASATVQITPEELARIRSENGASGVQARSPASIDNDVGPTDLLGTDASDTGSVGLAPEASDTGIMGPAPEASDTGVMGPAPEASDPRMIRLGPDAGGSNVLGPAPEASDPGSMGPAPEAGDIGPGGRQQNTNSPPPEGY